MTEKVFVSTGFLMQFFELGFELFQIFVAALLFSR